MLDFEAGQIILIDKPIGWTSFDVVKKIRNSLKIKKIGHAGTLDPLATGLLVICTGKLTKQIDLIQAGEKEYHCGLELGKSTPSLDLETEFDKECPIDHIHKESVYSILPQFLGTISQIPPAFSAVLVDGVRAYTLARKGEEVKIKERQVFIKQLILSEISLPFLNCEIVCSKGTYIRSLVRDFGEALQSCAYMTSLRRTRIGQYRIEKAFTPQDYIEYVKNIGYKV